MLDQHHVKYASTCTVLDACYCCCCVADAALLMLLLCSCCSFLARHWPQFFQRLDKSSLRRWEQTAAEVRLRLPQDMPRQGRPKVLDAATLGELMRAINGQVAAGAGGEWLELSLFQQQQPRDM